MPLLLAYVELAVAAAHPRCMVLLELYCGSLRQQGVVEGGVNAVVVAVELAVAPPAEAFLLDQLPLPTEAWGGGTPLEQQNLQLYLNILGIISELILRYFIPIKLYSQLFSGT